MTEHTVKQYDEELDGIRTRVLQMGGYVEQQVVQAMECLIEGDLGLADRVIENDQRVNVQQVELDEACTQIIARRQPAANDLRTIMTVSRAVTDLERVGDEAKKIAKVARTLMQSDLGGPPRVQMKHLGQLAVQQLRKALDGLARLDLDASAEVVKDDHELDAEFKAVMRQLITYMMEDPRTISRGIDVVFAAKALERIGDHAKNIAEHTIFLVHGRDVRHIGVSEVLKEVGYRPSV
ncbi:MULTISPECIES: phosphate signaling complex protein PhoU [Uliginosibacterium]|jgi:phosphate transport system protein|uniref:Phosphate-specific transport system accessory protein PhoU n=1 Tax=Uliginosibacterium aquaticum TaxID=2731212 RepID=A0ABX2IHZ5_9RHOO|nr:MULTISPECIES: phosphate signaling complex protein PhoU [Uliginosibacterium]MDO6387931.1 phosphate signaling complex protein PhoU [Uliginosibacterium sp. 31-12]NSL53993.1 phosphate signaling complex protein PhoU [Uliginosibacterium aquaticum]PLK50097.1 phosphate transport system regulatory protein PhoU [Uliginosibacterium sp. TH139]